MQRRRWLQAAAAVVLVALLGGRWLAVRSADGLWAAAMGVGATHQQFVRTETGVQTAALVLALVWCLGNLLLVYRSIRAVHVPRTLGNLEIVEVVPRKVLLLTAVGIGAVLALVLSHGAGDWWYARTLTRYSSELGYRDPVLGRDVSYYLFHLPWQRALHTFGTMLAGVLLAVVTLLYVVLGAVRRVRRRLRIADVARWHLAALSAVFALMLFWGYRLEPAEYAAGIQDVPVDAVLTAVRIPVARMLSVVALLVVLGSLLWLWTARLTAAVVAWVTLGTASFAGHYVVPSFAAAVRSTDELRLPDADARHAQFEQLAFGGGFDERSVDGPGDSDPNGGWAALVEGGSVVWDGFVVTLLLDRLAAPEPHQTFSDASLGLYRAEDGSSVPLYVAARLVDVGRARESGAEVTWDLVHSGAYAAGDGAVAVLAPSVNESGLPRFVPDAARPDAATDRIEDVALTDPRIVAAPGFTDWALFAPGRGLHGVAAGGLVRRLALAWVLQSPRIVTSDRVTDSTVVLWDRDVATRLERYAPFARFGQPRAVIDRGRLYWLAAGYVSAEGFPLSARVRWRDRTVRYLRSSLVGVVDAATGAASVYRWRDADPLTTAWSELAKQIVRPATELPEGLRAQLAFPEELLTTTLPLLQRSVFPSAMVGRPLGLSPRESVPVRRDPYWWVGVTSGDSVPRVRLLVPLENRETGRLAGLVDATVRELAPELDLYRPAPADAEPGPGQIARELARSRGNVTGIEGVVRLLPLDAGILALQSLYVSSDPRDTSAPLPQLIDVSVALRGTVGSGPTFAEAIGRLRVEGVLPTDASPEWGRARLWFQRMDAARRGGDWSAFGRAYDELRRLLVGGGGATP